ncbi:MAG: TRAP transporter large permease subunit [Burkholderiales bacterium]|nr:TRAP transporter large permease subunit [Burkholderiales bacterium]
MSEYSAFLMFPLLMVFIFAGFPVAFSMIGVTFLFGLTRYGSAITYQMVSKIDVVLSESVLAAVPLFIFMGAMLERSGIAERLFQAINAWMRRIPGGLGVAAITMGAIFAATSGIVGATETVIGLLAVPVMMKHGYDRKLIAGTICAGGSLATIIPPSISVFVLGPVANISVGPLLVGILFPGLIMAALFLLYVVGICVIDRKLAPVHDRNEPDMSWKQKLMLTLTALVPAVALIFAVLGTILMGLATPTEAAACGALGSVLLSMFYRTFTLRVLWSALLRSVSITAMILLIVLAGSMFSAVFFGMGGMAAVQSAIDAWGFSGWQTVALILFLTFLAGFVLDLISIILIIIPIAMPLIRIYQFDPVWFSVLFLIVLQTSYLSPPLAPSIFYLKAIAPPQITLGDMYRGVVPFIVAQLLVLVLVLAFPGLVTWLPKRLGIL